MVWFLCVFMSCVNWYLKAGHCSCLASDFVQTITLTYTPKHTCWCKHSQRQAPWSHLSCFLIDQVQPNNGCVCMFTLCLCVSVIFQSPMCLSVLHSLLFQIFCLYDFASVRLYKVLSFTQPLTVTVFILLIWGKQRNWPCYHVYLFTLDPHSSAIIIFHFFQECWSHDPSF